MVLDAIRTWWGAALLWTVLHSADYLLTIAGARLKKLHAAEVLDVSGSYELNPLFQKAIDEGRWWSKRFVLSLVVMAGLLAFLGVAGSLPDQLVTPFFGPVWDGVLGVLIFTRVNIIGRHLQNIWLFRRMGRDPAAVTGRIRYDRPTVLQLSSVQLLTSSGVLLAVALLDPSPLIIGGVLGCGLVAVRFWRLGVKAAAATAASPLPQATRDTGPGAPA